MKRRDGSRRARREKERGHLMVGLVAAVTIMLLFSTLTFQAWEDLIRRDNEAEMIFRAKQITRGILRYRKDHGGMGPLTLEQLAEPGPQGQYYVRRMFDDPLVKDGQWGLLYNGPGGNIFDPSAQAQQQGQQALPALAAGFEASRPDADARAAPFESGLGGAGGQGIGLPIAGVKSLCTDDPFRVYNGVEDYSQWLFTYIDLETGFASSAAPGGRQRGFPGQGQGQAPPFPGQNQGQGRAPPFPGQNPGGLNPNQNRNFPSSGSNTKNP